MEVEVQQPDLVGVTDRVDRARLAQSVERGTFNPKVKGSSPLSGDTVVVPV